MALRKTALFGLLVFLAAYGWCDPVTAAERTVSLEVQGCHT